MLKNCNVIKRVAICVIALTMSVAAIAQEKGDFAVGVNAALGAGDEFTNFGFGAKLQYNLTNPIRIEGAFNYFLPKDIGLGMKMSMFDASLNGHYLFRLSDKFSFYPLVGLGILNSKLKEGSGGDDDDFGDWGAYADYDDDADYGDDADGLSDTDFGFNVGAGFDLKLSEKLLLNVQAKYMLAGDWGRLIPSVGITYKF